jgi:hypothetical protein
MYRRTFPRPARRSSGDWEVIFATDYLATVRRFLPPITFDTAGEVGNRSTMA